MVLHIVRRDSGGASSPSHSRSSVTQTAVGAPRNMLVDGKIAQKLAEIAFIGAFLGQTQAAETIFRSLRILRPDNPTVGLGLAMVHMLAGHPEAGLAVVDRTPGLDPEHGLAAICTSLMLRDAGHRTAAEKKLSRAIARGDVAPDLVPTLSSAMRE